MTTAPKPRAPEAVLRILRRLDRRVKAMLDTSEKSTCMFRMPMEREPTDKDIKDRIRPYVSTWVEPDVEALLDYLSGTKTLDDLRNEWRDI